MSNDPTPRRGAQAALQFWNEYGMITVLAALCALFSAVTWTRQQPTGAAAGRQILAALDASDTPRENIVIVARDSVENDLFVEALGAGLDEQGLTADVVQGTPQAVRAALTERLQAGKKIDLILCHPATYTWEVFDEVAREYPQLGAARLMTAAPYEGSSFLRRDNLLNIANQIAVIAIIAIGMTMVIITGGIDLSVGSLLALSAVTTTWLIRAYGGEQAAPLTLVLASAGGMLACGALGIFSGSMVTLFRIPPFIATLSMMLIASGMAYLLSQGQSIAETPTGFQWLGRGADLLRVPNAVVLMLVLYVLAHLVMARTVLGRYLYAVGGNAEAARLSGVPVRRVLLVAYAASGLFAGLGGVVMASQFESGAPTYGQMYELYVIAAVVVGGTSLSGGEGRMFNTLVGALIIAVIQNGMNLVGIQSDTQKVVLGGVILAAVLLDRLRRRHES